MPLKLLRTLAMILALVLALLAILGAGQQFMANRADGLRKNALKEAVSVRAQGAALAFARALQEDWQKTKWTAERMAAATEIERQFLVDAMVSDGTRVKWAGYSDVSGVIQTSSGSLLVGQDVSARPWFKAGLNGPYAGDAHLAVLLGQLLRASSSEPLRFLDFAVPVTQKDGSTRGVFGIHIDAAWAETYLADLSTTLGINILLVDRSGRITIGGGGREDVLPAGLNSLSGGSAELIEWPDRELYYTSLVDKLSVGDMPDFGWRLVATIDPQSLSTLAMPATDLARLLHADRDESSLRSIFVILASFAALLGGLAIFFSYRAEQAKAAASLAEQKRVTSEQRFLALFGSANLPVAVVRGDIYQVVNEAAARLLGYASPRDLEGKTVLEVTPEFQSDGTRSADKRGPVLAELARTGTARADWLHLKADGSTILLDIILTVVNTDTGPDLFAVWTDITERREAEETIRNYQTKLEQAVAERTEELQRAYADLRVAKNESDQLAKLRSDFLATMSHEIRGPLNSLIGFVELANEGSSPQQQASFLSKALAAGQHLAHIVDDVLDLTRAEAGRIQLEELDFDLLDFSYATLEALEPAVRDKPIDLVFDFAPDVPERVVADPLRLRQVLMNYLSNAGKFTATGEICLSVRTLQVDRVQYLRFAVDDTGIGLRPDQRQRLFKSFSQADISIARLYGGSGLGLAICQQLATLMGGKVGFDSEAGSGSCFWFDLPLDNHIAPRADVIPSTPGEGRTVWLGISSERRRSAMEKWLLLKGFKVTKFGLGPPSQPGTIVIHDAAYEVTAPWLGTYNSENCYAVRSSTADTANSEKTIRTPVHPRRLVALLSPSEPRINEVPEVRHQAVNYTQSIKVLVADDDALNRDLARSRLEKFGLTVRTATNGTEALQAVLEEDLDLILMDHQMPVIDGIEATRRIRSLPSSRSMTPIVGITGSDKPEIQRACLAAGMNAFVLKPLSNANLAGLLAQFLKA